MKRVAVFGEIYSPNLGDGAIYQSLEKLFLVHHVKVLPVDLSGRSDWLRSPPIQAGVKKVGFLRRLGRIPLRNSRFLRRAYSASSWYLKDRKDVVSRWEKIVESCDAIVIGGGQLLTDINFAFPPRLLAVARLAKKYEKPLAVFGCGVGRDWGYLAIRMYQEVLATASYVSVRDHESANLLSQYLVGCGKVNVHPDPAFYAATKISRQSSPSARKLIGINFQPAAHFRAFVPGLRNLSDQDYSDFWYKLIRSACVMGETIIVLTNGDPADYETAQQVVTKLTGEGFSVELANRPIEPKQLYEQLSRLSTLICTRMHAGIVAYGLGVEVIPISWDRKVDGVWGAIGLGHRVVAADVLLHSDPWPISRQRIYGEEQRRQEDLLARIREELSSATACSLEALRVGK